MDNLREIILKSDTRKGKFFDIAIQLLIAISLISFSLETLPNLGERTYSLLTMIESVIVVIFSDYNGLRGSR